MQDTPLFRTVTGYQFTIRLDGNRTWTVVTDKVYEGEPWSRDDRDVYDAVSLAEAVDILLGTIYSS